MRLIQAVVGEANRAGWDGVVLDLEKLLPDAREPYPVFVAMLKAAFGTRRVGGRAGDGQAR